MEFLPEPHGAGNIAKQIKHSSRGYPLFGTGRLFLERPERHRVRITSLDPNLPLYQVGDGPVSFDRAAVERNAFRTAREEYYNEETVHGEPLKGNFANVARTRSSGLLIGPTNHHSYQPTLRRIYEERYSRRMSFQEFTQKEIEVVNDEQTVNDWKEQARSTTTYTTLKEAEPISFKSAMDAEQHFRKAYLSQIVKSGIVMECSGQASRALPDRSVAAAVRETWEKERAFPAGLVNYLRPYLLEAGLHFFKHRKRILYISAIKPVRHVTGQAMSPSVTKILQTIETSPKCTRRVLATKILGEHHEAPEFAEQKAALARDLHYLVHTGNVIEFHDGTLDLPLIPGAQNQQGGAQKPKAGAEKAEESGAEAAEGEVSADISSEAAIPSSAASEPVAAEAATVASQVEGDSHSHAESADAELASEDIAPASELSAHPAEEPLPASQPDAITAEPAIASEPSPPIASISIESHSPISESVSSLEQEPSGPAPALAVASATLPMTDASAEEEPRPENV